MNKIREMRKKFGYSQQKLAEKLGEGTTQTAISKWETGATMPREHHIEQMCRLFDVTPDDLMGRTAHDDTAADGMLLTVAEHNILKLYRGTDESGRKVILAVAEIEYERRRNELLGE